MKRAVHHSSRKANLAAIMELHKDDDVELNFDGKMAPSGDVTFTIGARNKSKVKRTVKVHMHSVAKYYTGVPGDELDNKEMQLDLDAEESKCCTLLSAILIQNHDQIHFYVKDCVFGVNKRQVQSWSGTGLGSVIRCIIYPDGDGRM